MQTEKLITVVIWGTILFVFYEAFKKVLVAPAAGSATSGGITTPSGTTSAAQALENLQAYFNGTGGDSPAGSLTSLPVDALLTQAQLDAGNFGGLASDNALDIGEGVSSNSEGLAIGD